MAYAATDSVAPVLATDSLAERICKWYEAAKTKRMNFETLLEECYEFTLPNKPSYYEESNTASTRMERIFDETAVVGVTEFASRIQEGVVPPFKRWATIEAGSNATDEEKSSIAQQIEPVIDYIFEILASSNFATEINEALLDFAVSTGIMWVEEGTKDKPIRFYAVPAPSCWLDTGPFDQIDKFFRCHKRAIGDIGVMWPNAKLPDSLAGKPESECVEIIECVYRDWTAEDEQYIYALVYEKGKELLFRSILKGSGSCPFIAFRWSKLPGEVYGRGPVVAALPAIRTVNLVQQYLLENAELAISGMWQVDDDGVINIDTIEIVPGTLIPKAPNSLGLQPIAPASSFDLSQFVIEELRAAIRQALYNNTLGPRNGTTPVSAAEVYERTSDDAKRIAAPFGRLVSELLIPLMQRVVFILRRQGLIQLPDVDGKLLKLKPTGPLALQQELEDVLGWDRMMELGTARLGPEAVMMKVDADKSIEYLARKLGVPASLIRTAAEKEKLAAGMTQIANATAEAQVA